MPYLLNSRYLVIVLLSLLFLGFGSLLLKEGNVKISEAVESKPELQPDEELQVNQPRLVYINSLPAFKLTLEQQMQPILDTGYNMDRAYLDYIESLTSILVTLASYYPPEQFGNQTPQEFITDIIDSRFRWYNAVVESHGQGTRGELGRLDSAINVAGEVEEMIEDMVFYLCFDDILEDKFNFARWKKAWRNNDF